MQNQNGPSDSSPSQRTSALSMGPPSAQPAVRLSSMPPATDAIDAEWGEDSTSDGATEAASGSTLDAARSKDVHGGSSADEPSKTSGSSGQAAEEHEQPTPHEASDKEGPSDRAPAAPASQDSTPPAGPSNRPSDTDEVPRPPRVRSLRSLQPTLLLFTGSPAPSSAKVDSAAPVPSAGADAAPSTPVSSPPGPAEPGRKLSDQPLAASAVTPVDASSPRSSEPAPVPSRESDAPGLEAPVAGSEFESLHAKRVGPWHVPAKADAAAHTAQASAHGSPPSPTAGSASNGPVASSLATAIARTTAAPRNTAWSIAVAVSAALAVAAGYWAFRPTTAETAPSTDAAARAAAVSPPPQARTVGVPEAESTPSSPAQPHPNALDDETSSSSGPSGASPEPASDKAAESQAQKSAADRETVSVEVKVIPSTAILFRGSKRLGEGDATVEVTAGKPVKLVILHRGYYYRRVKIDGSEPEVTVRLKKIMPDATKGDGKTK